MPNLTLLTACLNAGGTILRTCRSVDAQHLPEGVSVEHLILDGNSRDDTTARVQAHEELRNRQAIAPGVVRRLSISPDQGLYDALNRGLRAAAGDFIGILNADDFLASDDVVDRVSGAFFSMDTEGIYGDIVYAKRRNGSWLQHRYWKAGDAGLSALRQGWMPPHTALFLRKTVYARTHGFRTDLGSAADYEFLVRLMSLGGVRLAYVPEILVCMETGGMSNRSISARWKAHLMDRRAWRINQTSPNWLTLPLKPLRKIPQLWQRHKTFAFPEWAE